MKLFVANVRLTSKRDALELVVRLMDHFGITGQDFINENRRLREAANQRPALVDWSMERYVNSFKKKGDKQ